MFRPFQTDRDKQSEHGGAAGSAGPIPNSRDVLPTAEHDIPARRVEAGGQPNKNVRIQPFHENEPENVQ